MHIQFNIDTREPLSNEDKAILRAIAFMDDDETPPPPAAKKTAAAPAAKKAAAAPKPEPETVKGEVVQEDAEDDVEEARDAAATRARELLATGQRSRVMDALKAAGAEKVSKIHADKIPAFMAALTDED